MVLLEAANYIVSLRLMENNFYFVDSYHCNVIKYIAQNCQFYIDGIVLG
jgi:hypothetical protein